MDVNEWARKKAEQIGKQRDQAESKRREYLLDSEHLKNDTPRLWNDLCQQLKTRVDSVNQALRAKGLSELSQEIRPNETVIGINGKPSTATLSFDPEKLVISCRIVSVVTSYEAKAFQGNVYFADHNTGVNHTVDQIAEHVMDQIINYA